MHQACQDGPTLGYFICPIFHSVSGKNCVPLLSLPNTGQTASWYYVALIKVSLYEFSRPVFLSGHDQGDHVHHIH